MKKIAFILQLTLLATLSGNAQQFRMYQSFEAGITYLDHNKIEDRKLPGTRILLSGYTDQLEVRTVLPSIMDYSKQTNSNQLGSPVSFDLRLNVSPNKMQRFITSEKVFRTNGMLQLNDISKPVSVQYTSLPEETDNEGQMRLSLIATFHLSDFFPDEYPDVCIAFVISNAFVNRQ